MDARERPIYTVRMAKPAEHRLARLERAARDRIQAAIDGLAACSRPSDALKLSGVGVWRIRVGDFRVIYDVQDRILMVLIVKLGHRREIYR